MSAEIIDFEPEYNYEELARQAITLELLRQTSDDEESNYHEGMAEIVKHPMVILHLANYAATALATATGSFDNALRMWQATSPALAASNCEHGYRPTECDVCTPDPDFFGEGE